MYIGSTGLRPRWGRTCGSMEEKSERHVRKTLLCHSHCHSHSQAAAFVTKRILPCTPSGYPRISSWYSRIATSQTFLMRCWGSSTVDMHGVSWWGTRCGEVSRDVERRRTMLSWHDAPCDALSVRILPCNAYVNASGMNIHASTCGAARSAPSAPHLVWMNL